MSMRVGFVGLGYIGKPMALRLPAAGLETTVFDLVAEPVEALGRREFRLRFLDGV